MRRRMRIDPPAMIFGILFLAIALWWAIDHSFAVRLPNGGWLIAILLIAGGAFGIAWAIRDVDRRAGRGRRTPGVGTRDDDERFG
jgi:hypothetical protein